MLLALKCQLMLAALPDRQRWKGPTCGRESTGGQLGFGVRDDVSSECWSSHHHEDELPQRGGRATMGGRCLSHSSDPKWLVNTRLLRSRSTAPTWCCNSSTIDGTKSDDSSPMLQPDFRSRFSAPWKAPRVRYRCWVGMNYCCRKLVSSGSKHRMIVHFSCQVHSAYCAFHDEYMFAFKTKFAPVWLHLMFLQVSWGLMGRILTHGSAGFSSASSLAKQEGNSIV